MSRIIAFFFPLLFMASLSAQSPLLEKEEQKKYSREQKKQMKAAELERSAKLIEQLISNQSFILEGASVSGKTAEKEFVSPSDNYLAVNRSQASYKFMYSGYDHAYKGDLLNYEWAEQDKRQYYSVSFTVNTDTHWTYEVYLTVDYKGNATAEIRSAGSGIIARLSGSLKSPEDSVINF